MTAASIDDHIQERLGTILQHFRRQVSRRQGHAFIGQFFSAYRQTKESFEHENYGASLHGLQDVQQYFFARAPKKNSSPSHGLGNNIAVFTELRYLLMTLEDNKRFEEEMTHLEQSFHTYQADCSEDEAVEIQGLINNLHEAYQQQEMDEIREQILPELQSSYIDKAKHIMDISFTVNQSYQAIKDITKRQRHHAHYRPQAAAKNGLLVQHR